MTTYNTGNPLGSSAVKDIYDNAENLDIAVNDTSKTTWVDRFGVARQTYSGIEAKGVLLLQETADIRDSAAEIRDNIGFMVPVPYVIGMDVTTPNMTVVGPDGKIYAPMSIPFTTGVWDASQWYVIQNEFNDNKLIVFSTLAAATAAASVLPDGQEIIARNVAERYKVSAGTLVFVALDPDIGSVENIAELQSAVAPLRKRSINILGQVSAGDGGGRTFIYIPASTKAHNGITVVQPASMPENGRWECGPRDGKIPFEWNGIFANSGVDETSRINTLLSLCDSLKCQAKAAPGAHYYHNGYYTSADQYHFELDGDFANPPTFEAMQSAVDAGTVRMFRCEPVSDNFLLAGVDIAQSALPNDRGVYLTDTSGIHEGNILQLSSAELWYYDNRGIYTKGEIHVVRSVNHATGFVGTEDRIMDSYLTTDGYAKYVRTWKPNIFSLKNVKLKAPTATILANTVTVGYQYSQAGDPEVSNVQFEGMANWGGLSIKCMRPRNRTIRGHRIGHGLANGYCLQDKGSVGLSIIGLDTSECRRAFDSHGGQGTDGCVSRGPYVLGYRIVGGGAYFPDTAEESYGLGMHGPTQNLKFSTGYIADVSFGVNSRALSVDVDDVTFGGTMIAAVSLSYGAGLKVTNCKLEPNSKITDLVRLGISPGSVGPNALYTLPIVVCDNVLPGLRASLIRLMSPTAASNIFAENNKIDARPINDGSYINDGVFRLIANSSAGGSYSITGSTAANRIGVAGGSYALRPTGNMQIGVSVEGVIYAMLAEDKEWLASMSKDTVMKIPQFCRAGERPVISINIDAAGMSMVKVTPLNATLAAVGTGNSTTVVGTAAPASMTGTTGVDGNITVGLTAVGELWLENRSAGGAKQIRVSRVN